ncbi:TetR/AcrR family transcriptional regulator C-terminal domain-containing protein [Actinomadura verrucosospora]|uniref:TetR family transcriptional regulator n=1 Tax=Actinomadura verrucosospora TaxID=46165 RepID=A0A7D4AN76_ACTVE|nr:TetR/AcrR family transcriptional regulator C-terminal domain-containing protein [Actinomadura verrucosospora]QKG20969.1 TetR family transcriptional regulator [Actinomadura verrucosospora]
MAVARPEMPTPPGRRPRRPAPSRQPLTQERIVEAAITVLDAEGLEAVTMRRVAQELGTGPASLYAHVSDKQELRELMLDRVAGEVRLPAAPDPARWREQLKEIASEIRRVYTSHRDIAKVSMGLIPTGPNLLAIADMELGLMRAGGVPPRIAALAVDTLGMYLDADAIEDTFYTATLTGDDDPWEHFQKYVGEIREYMAALPVDRYPNIVTMIDDLTAGGGAERFEFGLDLLLRGIESYVEDRPDA